MKINVNQRTKIKLMPRGVKAFNRHYEKLGLDPKPYWEMAGKNTEEGWIELPLWDVIHIFGAACYMGPDAPFETEIEIAEKSW